MTKQKRHSTQFTINPTLIDNIVKNKKSKALLIEHCFQLHTQWKIICPDIRQDVLTPASGENRHSYNPKTTQEPKSL